MAKISGTTLHPIPAPQSATLPDSIAAQRGKIMGETATRVALTARLAERAAEAKAQGKREPMRFLKDHPGTPVPPVPVMSRAEVLKRAQTLGITPREVKRGAASILRRRSGGGATYDQLALALAVLNEDGRPQPLLDEEFDDAREFAELLWETEDPDKLVELLSRTLPLAELGDPKELLAKIHGLRSRGRDQSALMDLLAGLQAIPSQLEDRKALAEVIAGAAVERPVREASLFRLADLAAEQLDPEKFLSTFVDVVMKEVRTWKELLRSMMRGNPSSATSSETFKATVINFILAVGVEMQPTVIRSLDDKIHLRHVHAQLQMIYKVHSFIDGLFGLSGEVDRSIALLATS
jgi:hypothetical protein